MRPRRMAADHASWRLRNMSQVAWLQ